MSISLEELCSLVKVSYDEAKNLYVEDADDESSADGEGESDRESPVRDFTQEVHDGKINCDDEFQ